MSTKNLKLVHFKKKQIADPLKQRNIMNIIQTWPSKTLNEKY